MKAYLISVLDLRIGSSGYYRVTEGQTYTVDGTDDSNKHEWEEEFFTLPATPQNALDCMEHMTLHPGTSFCEASYDELVRNGYNVSPLSINGSCVLTSYVREVEAEGKLRTSGYIDATKITIGRLVSREELLNEFDK